MQSKYMIATVANHKLGDLSRDDSSANLDGENLCVVHSETDENYIGNWVLGLGFVNVEFPKTSTRDLTDAEIARFDRQKVQINSQAPFELNIKEK